MVVRVRIEDEKDTELDRMWAVNVKAPLSMIRTALPHLRRSGAGRIVNVVSIAGKAVYNNNAGYAMTKFAAVALSHAARRAGSEDGMQCTALCPGFVATDMTADVETFPHEQMMEPGDIAEVVYGPWAFQQCLDRRVGDQLSRRCNNVRVSRGRVVL